MPIFPLLSAEKKSSIAEDFDSDSQSPEPGDPGKPARGRPRGATNKAKKVKDEAEGEEEDDGQPVKAGTKQTKIDDFSPGAKKKAAGKTVNGASAAKKTGPKKKATTPDPTKAVVIKRKPSTSPVVVQKLLVTATPPRTKDSSSKKDLSGSPAAVVRRLKPPTLREDM